MQHGGQGMQAIQSFVFLVSHLCLGDQLAWAIEKYFFFVLSGIRTLMCISDIVSWCLKAGTYKINSPCTSYQQKGGPEFQPGGM